MPVTSAVVYSYRAIECIVLVKCYLDISIPCIRNNNQSMPFDAHAVHKSRSALSICHTQGCGLGLDVSVSAIYVSCPRPTQDHHHRYRADLYCYGASAWESVKEIQSFCQRLDFVHVVDKSKFNFFKQTWTH